MSGDLGSAERAPVAACADKSPIDQRAVRYHRRSETGRAAVRPGVPTGRDQQKSYSGLDGWMDGWVD